MTSCKLHLTCCTSCELFLKLANPFSFAYPISPQQADIFSSEWSSSRAICSMKDIIWPTWGCIKFTSAVRKFKQNKWNMLILIDYIHVPIFCGISVVKSEEVPISVVECNTLEQDLTIRLFSIPFQSLHDSCIGL